MRKLLLFLSILVLPASMAWAQSRTVSGKVTSSEDGESLPGVSVQLVGSTTGVVTDIDGGYKINVPDAGGTLRFTYIGFVTVEEAIGTRSVVNIALAPDVKQLTEVVVVGYGTQLKQDLTGNIAKVSGADIENIPVINVESAIQGRAAGVFIESGNGKLGQSQKIRIRGASSITGDNQPLVVVDGIVITSNSQSGSGAPTNPLADINFNDVESIDILKDASAAAIYGSRAANGVIIITTKKGKRKGATYNLNYQTGFSRETRRREFLNSAEYIELITESAANADAIEDDDFWSWFVGQRLDRYSGHTEVGETDTDWQDQAFQRGGFQQVDFSANGGTETTRFYVSGGYIGQEGILVANSFERLSARLNLEHDATDRLTFGLNMGLSRSINNRVAPDNEFATPLQLVALPPITPVRDLEGNLYDQPVTPYYNGLVEAENASFQTKVYRNLTKAFAAYKILPNLVFRSEFGLDLLTQNEDRFQSSITQSGRGASNTGIGSSRWVNIQNYTTSNYLNYNTNFGEKHVFDITGGFEFQRSDRDQTFVRGQGIPVDDLRKIASAAEITDGSSTLQQFTFLSYFARANYKFNNKYLISLSARTDASSRFGVNNRFGFFPAASVGWIASEEGFLSGVSAISFLKPRVSIGQIGNAEIGNFRHLGLYTAEGYAGVPGLIPAQIPNPDLSWEKTTQLDIGIDFGLLNDRITGEIDYYVKNTTDLLLDVPVPFTSGYAVQTRNIGGISNKGFEFVLNTQNVIKNNFSWSTSFNIAYNDNVVTDLGDQEIIDNGGGRYMNVVKKGYSIGSFFGAEYAGVDPANGDALWYINRAEQGDATTNNFNEADFVILGNSNPRLYGGLNNNFTFGNLDVNIFFQGVGLYSIQRSGDTFMSGNMDWFDNQTRDQLNRWQNPGDITDVPQARFAYLNGQQGRSSRYLSRGDYLRLKTVSIGYTLPTDLVKKANLSNVRVYMTGQNLLTFTQYNGWDPEVTSDFLTSNVFQSIDFYSAPQPRTIVFGVNIGF